MGTKRIRASITVFLALVFVLIVSMILVSLEAARAAVMRGCAQAALDAGIESVLADYYRPLFDRYKIFALDLGYGNPVANLHEAETRLQKYASLNSDEYVIEKSRIVQTFPITSSGGDFFIRQAVDAEKIGMVEGALEKLAEKLGLLTGQGSVGKILVQRNELETQMAGLDMYTADLMRIIDGVDTGAENILTGGRIFRIKDSFVKRFMIGNTDSISVGINNLGIYTALKDKYSNPVEKTAALALKMEEYAALTAESEAAFEEMVPLLEEIAKLEAELSGAGRGEQTAGDGSSRIQPVVGGEPDQTSDEDHPDTEQNAPEDRELTPEEKERRERLDALQKELDIISAKYAEIMGRVRVAEKFCRTETDALNSLYSETEERLREALTVTQSAKVMADGLRPKVEAFEETLKKLEGVLDEDTLAQLGSSLSVMKEYTGLESGQSITDFETIKETARADILLINGNLAVEHLCMPVRESGAIAKKAKELNVLAERMKAFSYEGMSFDYSVSNAESTGDAIAGTLSGMLLNPLSDYWLELLLGSDVQISATRLSRFNLPVITGREEADHAGMSALTGILGRNEDNRVFETICEILGNGFGRIYDKALFIMYLHDHFNTYSDDNIPGTVMKYEQEYLLCGNESDKVNLAGTLAQVMMIRLVPSMLFAFLNRSVSDRAGAVASAAVGFVGLPFLTLAVKYAILTVWAAEQAIVETAALLRGKSVPVLTNGDSFCLELSELVSLNSALVRRKADGFADKGISMSYNEYLFILLAIRKDQTLAGRALDLIQENLRYAYEDPFLISNCVVGFRAEAEAGAELHYMRILDRLPGVGTMSGYSVKVVGEGAYCRTE